MAMVVPLLMVCVPSLPRAFRPLLPALPPTAAQRFQVTAKTARKWPCRYEAEGRAGLEDRCSRPHSSPNATPEPKRQEVVDLRRASRRGAGFIAHLTGMHPSTATARRRVPTVGSTTANTTPAQR